MESLFEKLKKAKQDIHLDPERKKIMRAHLLRMVEADLMTKKPVLAHATPYSNLFMRFSKHGSALATLMIMVVVGGSSSLAAENTVPGDILYPLKVRITEPMITALSFSEESKGDWEVQLAERRLGEAVVLAKNGKLDEKNEEVLASEFTIHEKNTQERITKLEEKGNKEAAASLASRFEGSLRVHEEVLVDIEGGGEAGVMAVMADDSTMSMKMATAPASETSQSLKTNLTSAISAATEARLRLETKIKSDNGSSTGRAAQTKIKAASRAITESGSSSKRKDRRETSMSIMMASDTVTSPTPEDLLLEAKAKNKAKLYGEAFNLANQALRMTEEEKKSLEVRKESQKKSTGVFQKKWDENHEDFEKSTDTLNKTITSTISEIKTEVDTRF